LDIVAGIVEQIARHSFLGPEIRRDQSEIPRAQPPQQIVEGPIRIVRILCAWRGHLKYPSAPKGFDNKRSRWRVMCTSAQTGSLIGFHMGNLTGIKRHGRPGSSPFWSG